MKEERHALNHVNIYFIFFVILFLPHNLPAQIDIDGFGKTLVYKTPPEYLNILQVNFNKDEFTDIILYGGEKKKFVIQKGLPGGAFEKSAERFFYHPISNIKLLQGRENAENLFLFLSRSERLAGISSFTKSGTLQLLNTKKFTSYPSHISTGDVDLDGKNEALISGPAFDGLSLLQHDNLRLKEKKIISKSSFSGAEFININFDGFPDIAAIDLVANSLKIFLNNREGKFVLSRTIIQSEKITSLKICDINNDKLSDIAFIKNNVIEILLGDSLSSFENKMTFKFAYKPAAFEIADINNDNVPDLIVHTAEDDLLKLYYRTAEIKLPQPLILLRKKNIASIKILQRGKTKRLAAVSLNGELYVVGKASGTQKKFNFAAGYSPKLFTQSNKTNFIIYGDKDGQPTLNILSGNSAQRFQNLHSIPLSHTYSNFVAEDIGKGLYNFYLFSNKNLEMITFSEFDFSIEKKIFTPQSPPIDIRLINDSQIESKFIHILFNKNGKLGIENVEIHDDEIISQGIDVIDSNVVNAIISNGAEEEIHYWKYENGILTFNSVVQYDDYLFNFSSEEIEIIPQVKPEISFSFMGSENKNLISQVRYNDKTYFYLYSGKRLINLTLTNRSGNYNFALPEMLASVRDVKPNQFILYDKISESFKKVSFNIKEKKIGITNYIESKGVNGYFVSRFFENNLYLFYSDNNNNLITITKIE